MKCVNTRHNKITRFVQTYINFLTCFQIKCLHYIQKCFPNPTKIVLDDITVRICWENSNIYIMGYEGLSYKIYSSRGAMGGGANKINTNNAKEMLDYIKDWI